MASRKLVATYQDPQLNHLISTALTNTPTIKIAEARLCQAQQISEQSNASLFPSINGSGNITRQKYSANSLVPTPYAGSVLTEANLALNFNYEFDFWGKNREYFKATLSQLQASAADIAAAKLILTTAVAQTYFQLQADNTRIMLAKEKLATQ